MTRIAVIQGHPSTDKPHFCHALADSYAEGARSAGHEVRVIDVGRLDFPLIRSKPEWDIGEPPPAIVDAQHTIRWAQHLVIVYPLWLGSMPALMKGFLEQVLRPGFAIGKSAEAGDWHRLLLGRSARVIVTMGMPALVYRWYFGAHSLKSLERNILSFAGIKPYRHSLIGMVEQMSDVKRHGWLDKAGELGRRAI